MQTILSGLLAAPYGTVCMNSNKSENVLGQHVPVFFVICIVYLIAITLFGVWMMKKRKGVA